MSVIPSYALYGETHTFPDVLHCERIHDRAKGLDWKIPAHRHTQLHQFFLVTKGIITFDIDGTTTQFDQATLLNVPPYHVHSFHFSPDTQGYVLSCPISEIDAALGNNTALHPVTKHASQCRAKPHHHDIFDNIYAEFQRDSTARTPMLRAMLLTLLCHIARDVPTAPDANDPLGQFRRFERMMTSAPARPIVIADIARDLGVSRAKLHRICVAATGQSALRIAMQIKIQEAKRRLAYTQETTSEIGYRLGFDDPSYFSKVFRKYAGVTPTAYRAPFIATPDNVI